MSGATKGQKFRLGLFLTVAGVILGGTMVAMVGVAAFEKRDEYPVRFEGSVAGLSPGSPVRYNGIDVGRVEAVNIDPKKPSGVEVVISLVKGTPILTDTVATLNFQGITGLKFIELQGGSDTAAVVEVGSEIKSSRSSMDLLTDKAESIAIKIEAVLDNLAGLTGGENAKSISGILANVKLISGTLAALLDDNRSTVAGLVTDARAIVGDVRTFVAEAKQSLVAVQAAADRASHWVDANDVKGTLVQVQSTLDRLGGTLGIVDDAVRNVKARLSATELGATLTAITGLSVASTDLVKRADSTVLRVREDLLRALEAVTEGAESFGELSNALRDDPASLLRGKGSDRETPE